MNRTPKDGATGTKDGPSPPHELTDADIALATKIARDMAKAKGLQRLEDDMISAAYVGLLYARDNFDPKRGVKFPTYMVYRVQGALLDFLRFEEPPGQRRAKQPRERRHTFPFSDLSRYVNREFGNHDYSRSFAFDVLDDDFESIESINADDSFDWLLRTFKEKTARMLDGYYRRNMTMKAIGQALGLSESRISQMHTLALQRIAERFRDRPELMENVR